MSLKIMTYNVCYDLNKKVSKHSHLNPNGVIDAIIEADADLVCLQETNPEWETLLVEKLCQIYPTQKYLHNRKIGSAILLKESVMYQNYQEHTLVEPESWFPLQTITISIENQLLNIANVHLSPLKHKTSVFETIVYYFHEAYAVHLREVKEILSIKLLDVICGDFNEDSSGYAYVQMESMAYQDSVGMCENQITWTWPWYMGIKFKASLDHCFFSPRLECTKCEILSKFENVSDHFPVLTTFKIIPVVTQDQSETPPVKIE